MELLEGSLGSSTERRPDVKTQKIEKKRAAENQSGCAADDVAADTGDEVTQNLGGEDRNR